MLLDSLTLASAGLVAYHHAGYPILLKLLARDRQAAAALTDEPEPRRYRAQPEDANLPTMSVIIPAYNEAAVIAEKIRNLAIQDYPTAKLTVIVACDGCRDDTAALARMAANEPLCRHLHVQVREFSENRGKLAVLNQVIPEADGEVIVLTDASALLSVDALSLAAAHFRDLDIGVVCATYRLLTPGSVGERRYWDYQVAIKQREAALGAPLGAHGACYAFRAALFRPLAPDTINDDFILPMAIVAGGKRAVYDTRMVALELERASEATDRRRRRRIGAGNLQQVLRSASLLAPGAGRTGIAFAFASGKGLRPMMPPLMALAWIGSGFLAPGSWFFAAMFAGQSTLYALAGLRALAPQLPWPKAVAALHYLIAGHIAGGIGAVRYLAGMERGRWKRA